jgi:hypothetical protein
MTVETSPYPKQLVLRLRFQWFARVVSGMHQSDVVQHDFRRKCIHPEEVVGEPVLRHMQVSFGADDVGPPRGATTTLHPWGPELEATVVLQALCGHPLMVSEEGQQAWVVANQRHNPRSVWAAVDGIPQEDNPVVIPEFETVDQGAKGGKMAVNVANSKDAMPGIEPPLKVGFQRVIPSAKVRREFFFARQGCIHQGEVSP